MTADKKDRCGVWPLVLEGTPYDDICVVHDQRHIDQENGTHYQPDPELVRAGKEDPVMTSWQAIKYFNNSILRRRRETSDVVDRYLIPGALIIGATLFSWAFW